LKEIKDGRIKRRFEQNMSIEQIAQALDLPKAEVLLALEEMGLIERVNG
jgi:DNA-binding IclR family transcriptional regulator